MRAIKTGLACLSLVGVMLAAGCGSSAVSTAPTPVPTGNGGGATADVTITISNFAFVPASMTVKAGQTVAWRNADATAHTATADGGAFDTGSIAPGATSSPITMASPGNFAYHCQIHPNMVATLTVQ
jgi:plastocyanin